MGIENLNKEESLEKLKGLIEDIRIGMMLTAFPKQPLSAIPMATKKVDPDGSIWFLSLKSSEHNQNLQQNEAVQLLYSDPSDMEFLSVFGKAEVIQDPTILKELYNAKTDTWFEGPEDPELTAICVYPTEAYYWDTKVNKYVSLLKMGMAAISGDKKDIGQRGHMDL